METSKPLLTTSELAKILNCTYGQIYNLANAKKIPAIDIGTARRKAYRFDEEAVMRKLGVRNGNR